MVQPVDWLISGKLVNVVTGRIEERHIAIQDGIVEALEERPAHRTLETSYITPGLMDAHVHVESSMVTIPRYGEAVVPRGVTSIIHDPHEIANVLGEEGFLAALEDAEHTPLKVKFGVPSSVPATELQDAGARLDPETVARLLDEPNVVALAEVMNTEGVVNGDPDVHAKIQAAQERNKTVDGHLPPVSSDRLMEAAKFLENNHEVLSLEQAYEELRYGIHVYIREGTGAHTRNLLDLLPLTEDVDTRFISLCSDDRNVVDLTEKGGVDFALKKALAEGYDPITLVQMATLNTAEAYDLPYGRITPGAPADMVLLNDLESWDVEHVMIDGQLNPTENQSEPPPSKIASNTVSFQPVSEQDLAHPAPDLAGSNGTVPVKVIHIDEMKTSQAEAHVFRRNGYLAGNMEEDVLPIAVIERHGNNAGIGHGFIQGLGLNRGAIGSTVAHDAHNLIVAGAEHDDMARVANHLREIEGGYAAYDPEEDKMVSVSLPVAGLMSEEPLSTVSETFKEVEETARNMGLKVEGGIMEISFLALEVVPDVRITNRGLVDVNRMEHIDVVS